MTPRFKATLDLRNLAQLLLFFKLNTLLRFTGDSGFSLVRGLLPFVRCFFTQQCPGVPQRVGFGLSGGFASNLSKTAAARILQAAASVIAGATPPVPCSWPSTALHCNAYTRPVNLLNVKLLKDCSRRVLFYVAAVLPTLWWQRSPRFCYHPNVFSAARDFRLFGFYNGFFLRVLSI